MGYAFPPELGRLVEDKMATGEYASTDDLLLEAMRALVDRDEAMAGIREGIDDMESGRTRPLEEVDAELRKKHHIPRDA